MSSIHDVPEPLRGTDHDDFGSTRSKVMNVIHSKSSDRDAGEKPVSTFSHPALAALGRRDDLNLRPVLLRVMTDLFVAKSHHAPDEIRQFEEIALHMLGSIDGEIRAAIAGKLASYSLTPGTVIDSLVAYGGRAAAIMLEMSHSIDSRLILDVACFGLADLAVAVARRPDLGPEAVQALAERKESVVLIALASNRSIHLSRQHSAVLMRRARTDSILAATLLERIEDPEEAAPLFLAANAEQRRAVILAAKRRALGRPRQVPQPADSLLLDRLEKLATQPSRRPFAAALAATTGARIADIDLVVNDTGGEPLALVLAALGMTPEPATRIFLMSDPAIAHSYPRVAALR